MSYFFWGRTATQIQVIGAYLFGMLNAQLQGWHLFIGCLAWLGFLIFFGLIAFRYEQYDNQSIKGMNKETNDTLRIIGAYILLAWVLYLVAIYG